jgi:prepilin-type N-terminal cleavage/methylation domain-containing protein
MKRAFTLIEVMVSVMIISTVIIALLQIKANNTNILDTLKTKNSSQQYISLLIENKNYGYENKTITMDKLVDDFNIDNQLRQKLKTINTKIIYNKLDDIRLSDNNSTSSIRLEIGESILKSDVSSSQIYRFRIVD